MAQEAWQLLIAHADVTEEALHLLEKRDIATLADVEVNAAFRVAATRAHPDKGGDTEGFVALDRAKHVLLNWLARQGDRGAEPPHGKLCGVCAGKGYVESRRAWRTLKLQCTKCRGTGGEDVEHEKGDYR